MIGGQPGPLGDFHDMPRETTGDFTGVSEGLDDMSQRLLSTLTSTGVEPSIWRNTIGNRPKKRGDDDEATYTTVMLRNIPNKYTRQMLVEQLYRAGFKGHIDYMYLPTDFANRCNVGYCFLNFRTPEARQHFVGAFDGVAAQTCLPGFNSYKICQVTKAKWQGRDENVRRLRSGPDLMAQLAGHPEWLPLLFDEQGDELPFPMDDHLTPLNERRELVPRFQKKKKHQPDMAGFYGGYGGAMFMPDGMMGMPGMMQGYGGRGRGRGGDRRRRSGRGQPAYDPRDAAYSGHVMAVPVMTEQGLQFVPYDGHDQGFYPAYPMGFEGVPYSAPYEQLYGSQAYGYGYGSAGGDDGYDPFAQGEWNDKAQEAEAAAGSEVVL